MAADPVTPIPGAASQIVVGGTPVDAVLTLPNGGFIVNPANAADQGLPDVEDLFIDPVGAAGLAGNGTTFRIGPGQSWELIAGQTTRTSVNGASAGHKFSVVSW